MSKSVDASLVARLRAAAATRRPAELRGLAQRLADLAVVRPAMYLVKRLGFRPDVITRTKLMAADESARYILDHMMPCAIFDDRYQLLDLALRTTSPSGLLLEFGVFNGKSLNYWGRRVGGRAVAGFDSFEGLAEDWGGTGLLRGAFDVGGRLPRVPSNVTLVKGWFQNTLPPHLAEHPGPVAFAHLDADTYESTKYVLDQLAPRLTVGTVLQFDEYLGYPGWQHGEHKAWREFVAARGLTYKYLGVGWMSVAVQILDPGKPAR